MRGKEECGGRGGHFWQETIVQSLLKAGEVSIAGEGAIIALLRWRKKRMGLEKGFAARGVRLGIEIVF